ncbi:protein EMBRYO DEFECTIVE 514-like [Arachis stenosperma]|uniref:protein EMBRYO DEFECTIVE 514-like n=1 Tax=Arachis stenosperma TaxID=217475 RepID=UPI0025AD1E0A|nr:protein EMBRYO DEFECTIVE 514-like [Arachis stenosperma]
MAEGTAPEPVDPNAAAVDMELEKDDNVADPNQKRPREDAQQQEEAKEDDVVAPKKQKVEAEEKSVEEQRLEKIDEPKGSEEAVKLGPKSFQSSSDMFNYFYKFLHLWPHHLNINKYEHLVLLELLKKGHAESDRKIGVGIRGFQVRNHPIYKSRCFFLIREDNTVEDFSFRKCVDHILPLPEEMQIKSNQNKALGGSGGGRPHRGGKGGRGRGGKGGKGGKWRQ